MTFSMQPVVALTLGDPAGIGAELIARLVNKPEGYRLANIVLVGGAWLWEEGQRIAGVPVAVSPVHRVDHVRGRSDTSRPAFLSMDTVSPEQVNRGKAEAPGARYALQLLNLCMDAVQAGEID